MQISLPSLVLILRRKAVRDLSRAKNGDGKGHRSVGSVRTEFRNRSGEDHESAWATITMIIAELFIWANVIQNMDDLITPQADVRCCLNSDSEIRDKIVAVSEDERSARHSAKAIIWPSCHTLSDFS